MDIMSLGEIIDMIEELRKTHSEKEIRDMIVYIGDDEELNGIHPGYYAELLDENDENDQYILDEIQNDDAKKKGIILLS